MLTENKDWLFLAFFPQEDENELNRLRKKLTPFLKAVTKALSAELEIGFMHEMRESIMDEIIQNIPSENAISTTINSSPYTIDTLRLEFAGILDR